MATCSANTLLQDGRDFSDLGESELRVLSVVLLTKILLALNPMADVTASALMAAAKEFSGLSDRLLQVIQTQLLCNISVTGTGGSGTTQVFIGTGAPVANPGLTVAFYVDKSPTAQTVLYWWNGTTWIPFG